MFFLGQLGGVDIKLVLGAGARTRFARMPRWAVAGGLLSMWV